jgi:hypothetical protein
MRATERLGAVSGQELCAKCSQPLTEGNRIKIYSSGAEGVVTVQLLHKSCANLKTGLKLDDTPNKAVVRKLRFYWEKWRG